MDGCLPERRCSPRSQHALETVSPVLSSSSERVRSAIWCLVFTAWTAMASVTVRSMSVFS